MGGKVTHKVCKTCEQTKPLEEFERRQLSSGKRFYRARSCIACAPRKYVCGQGPHQAPNPCGQCGKKWKAYGQYSHIMTLKYCSYPCEKAARRSGMRRCYRCAKHLPFDAYNRDRGVRNTRQGTTCKQCLASAERDSIEGAPRRNTAKGMLAKARSTAKRYGTTCQMKLTHARKLYDSSCYFCGRAPHVFRPKGDPKEPWNGDNMRALCLLCGKMSKVVPDGILVLIAHEIVNTHPLVPKSADTAEGTDEQPASRARAS